MRFSRSVVSLRIWNCQGSVVSAIDAAPIRPTKLCETFCLSTLSTIGHFEVSDGLYRKAQHYRQSGRHSPRRERRPGRHPSDSARTAASGTWLLRNCASHGNRRHRGTESFGNLFGRWEPATAELPRQLGR